jgi:hypothetical protein
VVDKEKKRSQQDFRKSDGPGARGQGGTGVGSKEPDGGSGASKEDVLRMTSVIRNNLYPIFSLMI